MDFNNFRDNFIGGNGGSLVKMQKKKTEEKVTTDIFSGEYISVWEDEYFVWMSMPFVTLNIPKDEWADFKKDLERLGDM